MKKRMSKMGLLRLISAYGYAKFEVGMYPYSLIKKEKRNKAERCWEEVESGLNQMIRENREKVKEARRGIRK